MAFEPSSRMKYLITTNIDQFLFFCANYEDAAEMATTENTKKSACLLSINHATPASDIHSEFCKHI
jgi:hypothetical protein